jgi:Zn-dependent protease with chaperone function
MSMWTDSAPPQEPVAPEASGSAVYFDGSSSRRHLVTLVFKDRLELDETGEPTVAWSYDDIRRADGPSGVLRLRCETALALARLEIRDTSVASELMSRCARLDEHAPGRHGVGAIIGWSLAAAASIVAVVVFGVPLAADRLTPLVPQALERRLGDAADGQVKAIFGDKMCNGAAGQQAFGKLMDRLRETAGLDNSVLASVLATPVANAFALPGGRIYLFSGLLAKAENPDEIAGVLAHELGHLKHRDATRNVIYNGGTSFLIGLLFGDITGSGALIMVSRTLVNSSYSREVEQDADSFAIDVMHKLGRSPKGLGELLFRVIGKDENKNLSILASHPLTEDRLARMRAEDRPPSGPPLLTDAEWLALKAACASRD